MQKFKTAGYIRLSKEDKIKDESNSVANKKIIIKLLHNSCEETEIDNIEEAD